MHLIINKIEKKIKKQVVVARKPRPGEEITQVSEVGGSVSAKVLVKFSICFSLPFQNA